MNLENVFPMVAPFLDSAGNAYAHIPGPNDEKQEVLLLSNDFRAWMRKELHLDLKSLPSDKQLEQGLEIILGYALEQPRRSPTIKHKDDSPLSPLGQVIEYIARNEGPTVSTPVALVSKCLTIVRKLGLVDKAPDFPTNEDKLGNQLVDLIPVMEKRGILLERDPKDRPRKWTIRLMNEDDQQPKTVASPPGDASVGQASAATNGQLAS